MTFAIFVSKFSVIAKRQNSLLFDILKGAFERKIELSLYSHFVFLTEEMGEFRIVKN